MNTSTHEDLFIESLVSRLPRSSRQLNELQGSDAELIRLPGSDTVLAITTDSIVEEIETGLYEDPYLIGWMTVLVNASDLAAVGADPLGILLNLTVPPDAGRVFLDRLQAGVGDACRAAGLAVLGGDTNFSSHPQFGGTAVGLISNDEIITRHGCHPGDQLFSTGPLGAGSAYALTRLRLGPDAHFRPVPRFGEGALIRRFGSCVMDTSDGVYPTLDHLGRVNGVGFELDARMEDLLHPLARGIARANGIAPWMMLAGPHGEFELLFTLPLCRNQDFLREASEMGWKPVRLGRVVEESGVCLVEKSLTRDLDTAAIRDLAAMAGSDVDRYLEGLAQIGDESLHLAPMQGARP